MTTIAIAHLKRRGRRLLTAESGSAASLSSHLCNAFFDKGYDRQALHTWFDRAQGPALLSQIVGQFMLNLSPYDAQALALRQGLAASLYGDSLFTYTGSAQDTREIDAGIASDEKPAGERFLIGRGAARYFSLHGFHVRPHRPLAHTPIIILGAGASGILLARTLVNAGFDQVQIIDVTGQYGGIWRQKNVRGASKNNPFPFAYEQVRVEAAPGPGEHITHFLATLAHPPRGLGMKPLPPITQGKVLGVEPGDLLHRAHCLTGEGERSLIAPIVVAALGVGKPLAPSRTGIMTTDVPASAAGIRWQQVITPEQAKNLNSKTLVFIGLGNSTAEMLVQIQHYNRAGMDIRYKVLTHYPLEALNYPHYTDEFGGRPYRLYRDLLEPQLTKLAGDLEPIRSAYEQAFYARNRDKEEIIAGVTHWTIEAGGTESPGRKRMVVTREDGEKQVIEFDQLYTLIGYGHSRETHESLGMRVVDEATGAIAYDYDGEVQRPAGASLWGRERVYPGYFALGSLLKTPLNPNAQVIPGILYRLPDLFASLLIRAMEYSVRRGKEGRG